MLFALSLCRLQLREHRGFVLEQPASASSWQLDEMNQLEPGVYQILLDMCRFGLRAAVGHTKISW